MPEAASKSEFFAHLDEQVIELGAQKEVINLKESHSPTSHQHFFSDLGSRAECPCGWGLFLDAQDKVVDGHLYRNSELVI